MQLSQVGRFRHALPRLAGPAASFFLTAVLVGFFRSKGPGSGAARQEVELRSGHSRFAGARSRFGTRWRRTRSGKPAIAARQKALLEAEHDLSDKPDPTLRMSRGKPVQVGPAVRLPQGMTLGPVSRRHGLGWKFVRRTCFRRASSLCRILNHEVGGMVFPQMEIKLLARLERFDLDFDLPEHFLPEFPPAIG